VPGTPLIGMTTYGATASWGPWRDVEVSLLHAAYHQLVFEAGARPLLLPHSDASPLGPSVGASDVIGALDGLVIIGGLDVDPALYGEELDPTTGPVDPVRDTSELALLEAALEADLPLLAICRGHQLLNVGLGGTLLQHVPDHVGHVRHQPATGSFTEHEVACVPGTRTAAIFGERPVVACSHHQAIGRVADGLEVTAWSIEDAPTSPLVEAVELPTMRFCIGVQWHPEQTNDVRPFTALVESI
jgi:putative glutamine amidotransferase